MTADRWEPGTCAIVGAIIGPVALLVLWLSSMGPWPADALMSLAVFFGGSIVGGAAFALSAVARNAFAD